MPILDQLAPAIAARMAAAHVPGLALALVRDGAVAEARGFGVTSVEDGGRPITPQTLFQIGSTTKPLTGTLVMRLVTAGLLDLDRPVRDYLPDLTLATPGAAERVTLRRLLSHTAGLPWDQITPTRLHGRRDPAGLADYVREVLPTRPLAAPPGTCWVYSNPGINLAARIAEVVTGRHYADLIAEQVTAPLGMARTTFDPAVALTYPVALCHDLRPDGTLVARHRAPDNTAQYPSAFAYSTVLDNFALCHLQGGRYGTDQFLPPDLATAMQTTQADCGLAPAGGPPSTYGLTFFLGEHGGHRTVGHPGGIGTFGSQFELLPDAGVAAILLYNRGEDFGAHATAIVADALGALLAH